MSFQGKGLGRLIPKDFSHINKHNLKSLNKPVVQKVEKQLIMPDWIPQGWDQGNYGACTGFGTSLCLAIINNNECRANGDLSSQIKYQPYFVWNEAKKIDGFEHTDPNDGSTVLAACTVLQTQGAVLWDDGISIDSYTLPPVRSYGIKQALWTTSIDDMRSTIANNIPIAIGVSWMSGFDNPQLKNNEYWISIAAGSQVEGGHCLAITGCSDLRQAFQLTNSWGSAYPQVWISYKDIQTLINQQGEFGLLTDY